MARRYFGTDGIRGRANIDPMSAEVALKVGMAAGSYFRNGGHRARVIVGKDTRLSGYLLEQALTAGFIAVGCEVILVGPLPTPAIAMLTRSLRADLGVMISASHNPYQDNGIKLFGPDAFKLSDAVEGEIEALMDAPPAQLRVSAEELGRAQRLENARGRYIESVKSTFPRGLSLSGMKVVIDCANGAAYQVAPTVLWELGADVIAVANKPDGTNINRDCGSTCPELMRRTVVEQGADIGIALDGDADRVLISDEAGRLIDGDQIMALIANGWHRAGRLAGGGIVATVMSNMGLERFLAARGLTLPRTKVGDRYVAEHMRAEGFNVGGEQSGHMILSDYATTGDGLIAGLQVLAEVVQSGKPVSEATNLFVPMPQRLRNVRYAERLPLADARVEAAIEEQQRQLNGHGRLVIRRSGTEPLIRVMAEAEDEAWVDRVLNDIVGVMTTVEGATEV